MIRQRGLVSIQRILFELVHSEELAEGEKAMKDQLEQLIEQMYSSGILYSEAVREFKKRFIMQVLKQNRGNQSKTARFLGMHRNTFSRTAAELKINTRDFCVSKRYSARKPTQTATMAAAAGARQA
jgi:Fis family transcriptional regulator, factor for inversion stimulation protein